MCAGVATWFQRARGNRQGASDFGSPNPATSFPRMRESTLTCATATWIPAFAGMTSKKAEAPNFGPKSGRTGVKKIILLVIVIAAAVWYFDLSHKMTETAIRKSYQTQFEALQRFDPKPLCDVLDDDYTATVKAHGAAKAKDKASACAELTRGLRRLKTLSDRTAGLLEPDYDFEIKSISLSADRKFATVEVSSTMRLGDMTLARSRQIDHLISRMGRIRSTSSEESVWAYRPE